MQRQAQLSTRTFLLHLTIYLHYHFDVQEGVSGLTFCEELSTLRSRSRFADAYNSGRDRDPRRQIRPTIRRRIRQPNRLLTPANRSQIIRNQIVRNKIVPGGSGSAGNRVRRGLRSISISSGNEPPALRQRNRRTLRRGGA